MVTDSGIAVYGVLANVVPDEAGMLTVKVCVFAARKEAELGVDADRAYPLTAADCVVTTEDAWNLRRIPVLVIFVLSTCTKGML